MRLFLINNLDLLTIMTLAMRISSRNYAHRVMLVWLVTHSWCRGKHIALDIVKGLIYLHSRDIAHLDVKSPNVMLAADGRAKLGDVGLGKLVASARAVATDQGKQRSQHAFQGGTSCQ